MKFNTIVLLYSICILFAFGCNSGCKIAEEVDGYVEVEAEKFYAQEHDKVRRWYVHTQNDTSIVLPDVDPNHALTASGNAYIEILPDTRASHKDILIRSENFTNVPGKMAVVSYKVKINSPGKYYVWVRAFSTNSEDNGVHVGLNGSWPESGQRMQWCTGKHQWTWESKQRTAEVHCGVEKQIYLEIKEAGIHTISFSMREDGFEFDKFALSKKYVKPE